MSHSSSVKLEPLFQNAMLECGCGRAKNARRGNIYIFFSIYILLFASVKGWVFWPAALLFLDPVSFLRVGDKRPTSCLCAVVRSDAQLRCARVRSRHMCVRAAIVSRIPSCLRWVVCSLAGGQSPLPLPRWCYPACLLFSR